MTTEFFRKFADMITEAEQPVINEAIQDTEATQCKERAAEAKANGDKLGYWTAMYWYNNRQKSLYGAASRSHGGQMSRAGSKYSAAANKYLDKMLACYEKVEKLGGTIDKSNPNTYDQAGATKYATDFAKNVSTGSV